jgi:hypothetical protein
VKKKAKGKIRAVPKKPVVRSAPKKSPAKKKKGTDIVEVRESINELVKESAELIATSVIEVATRTGQLASAKYLFEAIGLYPATEQTEPAPLDGSLAHTLLARMGIPTEPVIYDDDEFAIPAAGELKEEAACMASENSGTERKGEQERVVEIGEAKPACEGDAVE